MSDTPNVLDSRERFTVTAATYARYRPSYPKGLVDCIVQTAEVRPGARIADVGCGTGISTRLFMDRGFDVVGIDPNEGMLAEARRDGGAANYQRGDATATGLASGSVDLVTVAQAFHWFDVPMAMAEFRRILKAGGWCAAFWNVRTGTPFMRAYEELLNGVSEYRAVPKPREAIAAIEAHAGIVSLTAAEFPNAQLLDRTGLFGRAASSSYVAHGVEKREVFERSLGELFDRHAVNGVVEFTYVTRSRMWRFA